METIKSYTTIEQSHKLAEILPLESADMHSEATDINGDMVFIVVSGLGDKTKRNYGSPVWSLAALFGVLKEREDCIKLEMFTNKAQLYRITTSYYKGASWENTSITSDNPIDACYEMIIKLNELKIL